MSLAGRDEAGAPPAPFSRAAVIGLVGAGILTFVLSLAFMISGEDDTKPLDRIGASTFSSSAIGYQGIAELLTEQGIRVVKARHDPKALLGAKGLLVLAEPEHLDLDALPKGRTVLLILPKWAGRPDAVRSSWLGTADLVPTVGAYLLLRGAASDVSIVRPDADGAAGWEDWTDGDYDALPTIDRPQLITSKKVTPLVGRAEGILVGEVKHRTTRIVILADPDPLANHGIAHGANAAFAVALVRSLIDGDGPVVFDETAHGYEAAPPSQLGALFGFPFVFFTVQALLVLLLAAWSGIVRFGAPAPAGAPRPPGKEALLDSTAGLLHRAGYDGYAVRRYFAATLGEVLRRTHAPRALDDDAQLRRLQQIGTARGATVDPVALRRAVDALQPTDHGAALLGIAGTIHRWRREIIDGRGPGGRGIPVRRASIANKGADGPRGD